MKGKSEVIDNAQFLERQIRSRPDQKERTGQALLDYDTVLKEVSSVVNGGDFLARNLDDLKTESMADFIWKREKMRWEKVSGLIEKKNKALRDYDRALAVGA